MIKEFIGELRARNLSKNTIRLAVTTLRAVLSSAVEDGLIRENPGRGLERFVKSEKAQREATTLRAAEVETLLQKAKADLRFQDYALLLTALRAGLREGELAALQWEDVHFGLSEEAQDRFILVQRNYDRRWSRRMLTPKSKKTRRVDVSRELRRVLLELRHLQRAYSAETHAADSATLVFPSQTGTPIEMNNFYARGSSRW